MSAIHELTSIAPLQEFSIFEVPATQVSVNRTYDVEYFPLAPVTANTPIEFQIRSSEYHYTCPSEIYLKLDLTLGLVSNTDMRTEAAQGIYAQHTFQPIQNLLNSLFKNVEITVGGKIFRLQPLMHAYRSYIEVMMGYDSRAKSTHLSLSGWTTEAERRTMFHPPAGSTTFKTVTLIGRIFSDITHQAKSLLGGMKIDIKLDPNDPSFYTIHSSNQHTASAKFENVSLLVKFQEATEHLRNAHNLALSKATAKIPITNVDLRHYTLARGANDAIISNAIQGTVPRRTIVFFVNNSALNGAKGENPFKFEHKEVKSLHCEMDGMNYPTVPYKTDFARNQYHLLYLSMFRYMNQNVPEPYYEQTYADFKNFPMWIIQFCPDLSSQCGFGGHVSPIHTNQHITLKVEFGTPLDQVTTVILFNEYDDIIEYDRERNAVASIHG